MNILIISPIPSHPQYSGNSSRIFNMTTFLKHQGHLVYFCHVQHALGDNSSMQSYWGKNYSSVEFAPYLNRFTKIKRSVLRFLKITDKSNYLIDDWYPKNIENHIKQLNEDIRFDMVIVEYVFLSKILDIFHKNVTKVIDTHDIFADRNKTINEGISQTSGWFSTSKKDEIRGLNRADILITISINDYKYFKNICKSKVVNIEHFITNFPKKMSMINDNKNILFVGSKNLINIDSINHFITVIYPIIKTRIPKTKLYLAGSISEVYKSHKDIVSLGTFDDPAIVYSKANIVINPVNLGTGLSIKTIEALSYGKALVSTPEGVRGISNNKPPFLVVRSDDEFVDSLLNLIQNPYKTAEIGKCAYEFAISWRSKNQTNILKLFDKSPIR